MKRLLLSSILLGVLATVGCQRVSEEVAEAPRRPAKFFKIEEQSTFRAVRLPAVIEAAKETVATFQVPGRVDRIDVQEGEEIEKGQVLAKLDQRDFRNALASAQADFEQAQTEFRRAKNLIEQNAIAQSIYDQRLANHNKAKSALDSAVKRLEDSTLRAPYDAIIAKVHIESFENVAPQQPVVTLLSASGSNAIVQVPASLVVKSESEMPVEVTLTLDAVPDISIPTSLLEAAATADPGTQTFEVRYAFTAPEGLVVLPGMTGTLTGQFKETSSQVRQTYEVPLSAIVSEAGQTFVWIVDPEAMTVTRRDVRVTAGADHGVTISGVEQGETLVGVGGQYLFEGAKVRPYVR